MDRQQRRATLAGLMASVVLVAAGVTMSSAAPARDGRCNPRKTVCATTTTSTSTTSTSTSTTSTTSTTVAPTDTTPPTAQIGSPSDGTAVASTLGVTGTSADDQQVARVELSIDGGGWMPASGTSSWSMSVDTSAWAAGSSHAIGARAIDAAGNASAVSAVTVQKAAATTAPGTGDPSLAPATQGTWTSPEGAMIDVATAGVWTIRDIYRMLLENASAPGDFAKIAPTLTVRVQDTTASQTLTTARSSNGVFTQFNATVYLKGVSSTFANQPDAQLGHEYGHVWTKYHLYMSQGGSWATYLDARWSNADGSLRLAQDSRLDTSYVWDRAEIIADDYRLLLGSPAAISQRPSHMNSTIPVPGNVPGLREMLLSSWAG